MSLPQLPNTALADPVTSKRATDAMRAGLAAGGPGDARDRVTTPSPTYERLAPQWARARRLVEGTRELREHPEEVLPKWPGEEVDEYAIRVALLEVFGAYERTCETMAGMLTLRDPQLSDAIPAQVRADWADLDGRGTDGAVAVAEALGNAFPVGFGAWLIDAPRSPAAAVGRAPTIADEQGLRPFWRWYPAEDVLEATTTRLPTGRETWSRVRLREVAQVPTGKYGWRDETRVRVLTRLDVAVPTPTGKPARVAYELIAEREVDGKLTEVLLESGLMTNVSGVPFVPLLLGRRKGAAESTIPLEALLWLNMGHTRTTPT
jgi:hypothetical protein